MAEIHHTHTRGGNAGRMVSGILLGFVIATFLIVIAAFVLFSFALDSASQPPPRGGDTNIRIDPPKIPSKVAIQINPPREPAPEQPSKP